MKNRFHPLFLHFITYSSGILVAYFLPGESTSFILWIALSLASLFWLARWRNWFQFASLFFFAFFGICRTDLSLKAPTTPGDGPRGIPEREQSYRGEIISYPTRTDHGFTFLVDLQAWLDQSEWKVLQGRTQVSLYDWDAPPQFGNTILFRCKLMSHRNLGNAGEFNSELYARARGIDYVGGIHSSKDWALVKETLNPLRRLMNGVRAQALERSETYLSPSFAPLFRSIVLGEQGGLSRETKEAFRKAGVAHLLVVSGFHVAAMAVAFGWVLGKCFSRSLYLLDWIPVWRIQALGGLAGALFFSLLTNVPIPTLRALLGLLLGLLVVNVGRAKNGLQLLMLVAFLLFLIEPLWLLDLSTQLSLSAVLGILVSLQWAPLLRCPTRWVRSVWLFVAVTLGATAATFPFVAWNFHTFSAWSLVGNLLFVPLLGTAATTVGVLAAFLGSFVSPLGNFLFCCLDRIFSFSIPLLLWVSHLPGSDILIPNPISFWSLRNENVVSFLHVGQGDAIALRSSDGRVMLVDAGPGGEHSFDAGEYVLLPWLRFNGFKKIDVLVLTHSDLDHIGGAKTLINSMEVGEIWSSRDRSFTMRELSKLAHSKGVRWRDVSSESPPLVWSDMKVEALHPPPVAWRPKHEDNNRSLVLKAELQGVSFLLTADIEREAEIFLTKKYGEHLRSDFLKVAHHGSQTSTTHPFLSTVLPQEVIIMSRYKNRFGHPHPSVIERIHRAQVRIWRGDVCGEIDVLVRQGAPHIRALRNDHYPL